LAFFIRPLRRDGAPGVPMPMLARSPSSASASSTSVPIVSTIAS